MNATATTQLTPIAEVTMTRAAKEELLRQMYSRTHWIELIRLFGYQTLPMDQARNAIKPLAEQFGKEPVAAACEILVEISMQEKEPFARLKPHVRRMAFQILGPEPSADSVAPTASSPPPSPDPPEAAARRHTTPSKKKMPAKSPAPAAKDAVPASAGSRDAIMEQYRAAKEKHPNMLLLFRMGDFYELFDQDAETAHKLLGLTLTTRDRTVAMAGFPHHQLEVYLHKLLHEGQRVAICEPVEESLARGPIRREVTRVVAPDTMIDGQEDSNSAATAAEDRPVRQPRHFVLKEFEAWLNKQEFAFVAVADVQRTTPAVAPHVGALDFIVMRGDEKLLVTVRPHLQAKHLTAIGELQTLFGAEYKPLRFWPSDARDGWNWHDYPVEPAGKSVHGDERKPTAKRSRANKPQ